jgi:hypothetical protein
MTYIATWINRSDISSELVEIELILTDDSGEMPNKRVPFSFNLPCASIDSTFLNDVATTTIDNVTNEWNARADIQLNRCKENCASLASALKLALLSLEEIAPIKDENATLLADLEEFEGRI